MSDDDKGKDHKDQSFTIVVNGKKKTVEREELSYEQVVHLAFPNPPTGPNIVITVTYHNGPHENREGSLSPGHSVHVKNEMVFDVTATDKS